MNRRHLIASGSSILAAGAVSTRASAQGSFSYSAPITVDRPLMPRTSGSIQVAFAIAPGVQVIDLAGPWEVFQDVRLPGGESENAAGPVFSLYTVSETTGVLRASGGLQIRPDHSVADAPDPDVLVVPHFSSRETTAIHEWIKQASMPAQLTMSVCTGAFQLAKTGLLDGLPATTNQLAYDDFATEFPQVQLHRGPRFVETMNLATAGGLSAGIDLALRVVVRFFGHEVAQQTADVMEYVGDGWRVGFARSCSE